MIPYSSLVSKSGFKVRFRSPVSKTGFSKQIKHQYNNLFTPLLAAETVQPGILDVFRASILLVLQDNNGCLS